jgi:hypothetical protein
MKRLNNVILIVVSCCLLMAFTSISRKLIRLEPIVKLEPKPIEFILDTPALVAPKLIIPTNRHQDFLNAVGFKESGNRYDIVNRFGYMGRYQFGKRTLRGLGFKASREEFLNSPEMQELAMYELLKTNKKYLRKYIEKYDGEVVHGVLVTESGLLAAAHLGGAGSVKKWFKTGKVRRDGNGVKITNYMEKFSGYKLDLN